MIINFTRDGWEEIRTKKMIVTHIDNKPFIKNKDWLSYNKRYGDKKNKRQSCKICGEKWKDTNSDIYIILTNKGNKPICLKCRNRLEANIEKTKKD